MNTFQVGQPVICVGDDFPVPHPLVPYIPAFPCKGHRYTIREVYVDHVSGVIGVRLQEIHCLTVTVAGITCEVGWSADYFRPVAERKTDTGMAILRKILTDCPAGADVPA